MNERQQSIFDQTTASLVNGPKSLKAVTDEVNIFFSEQNLGDHVSQDEVCSAIEAADSEKVEVYERNHEVWLRSSDTP